MMKKKKHPGLPFVSFEVLQLDPEDVVLVVGQHVNVFVAKPELFARISEAVLVIGPVSVEVLSRLSVVVSSLYDLKRRWWIMEIDCGNKSIGPDVNGDNRN